MKRIARIQQRKRQTWLDLPASAIEEVSHGCRSERTLSKDCGEAKDSRRGTTATMAGTRQALADLMAWHGIEEQGEAMTLMIHHLHSMGPAGSAKFLAPPRHKYVIPENVSRKLKNAYEREELRLRHYE